MTMSKKPKILVLCDYYLPGYKSGGGMRTIVNMVERLHHKFDFYIITRDHDGKEDFTSYKTVKIDDWNVVENAQTYYLPQNKIKISKIHKLISEVKPDSIYTNSYFATPAIYMLILRRLGRIAKCNVIVAPCGELSEGALSLKSQKKKAFIRIAKSLKLYNGVIWKASNELERMEIERINGKGNKIFIAPDLTPKVIFPEFEKLPKITKNIGEATIVFLSRFSAKKNFKWLLERLEKVEGNLIIDVYGPLEDELYWQKCLEMINILPSNIKIDYKGTIPHESVPATLNKYHFFILPTLGENFGHVFLEALAAGCPLLISDRTPWLKLDKKGIGWDISLEKPEKWMAKINECIKMDDNTYSIMRSNARRFVCDWLNESKIEEETLKVLDYSLKNK